MNKTVRNKLIAVVDDEDCVRSGTASLLRAADYATECFASAEDLLASGDHHRFACVVADIQMSGMSGIELANRLGRDVPPTPVVIMTARTEKDVLASAGASRASCLLRKPFTADELLECVSSVMP